MKKKKNRALDTNQIVIEMGALHAFSSLHYLPDDFLQHDRLLEHFLRQNFFLRRILFCSISTSFSTPVAKLPII